MIIDRLYRESVDKSPICVGLDTRLEYLPEYILDSDITIEDKIFEFNKKIIDNTFDLVACYKVQIAFYESLGIEGLKAYSRTLKYIKEKGKISIADVKRGDISSTAQAYGKAHFEGDFEADFITVNPYMGIDSVSPYFKYMENGSKGIFMLIRTSNKGSEDFQGINIKDRELFMKVSDKCKEWGENFIGKEGFSSLGGVVGLTYPEEFLKIRRNNPNTFFLIPGYGAQGGSGKDIKEILKDGICGVINSSRGIITAHKRKVEDEDFIRPIRDNTLKMKEDIEKWLK
ncbi:orotidine-5'-phosphate decarboxylase [Clostridium sp. D2Q-14]|uniref:orotidine-5'-phosphate decarboxylase n=1 Tax=Anaeromonas gelatinilytica TaxID=2683194 RepID=UPI00193BA875|nr:orotidine-5'-phosphate decarboxylase [Anaeromonas gelatinilytica]MBS4535885.1 orotidine-5'-phosphate decarboxylase [Anaeromonas gelatinilytica]